MSEATASVAPAAAPAGAFVRKSKAEKRELKAAGMKDRRVAWRQREKDAGKAQVARRAAERAARLTGMSEAERAAFDAIGESDRMTLRFRKPT